MIKDLLLDFSKLCLKWADSSDWYLSYGYSPTKIIGCLIRDMLRLANKKLHPGIKIEKAA